MGSKPEVRGLEPTWPPETSRLRLLSSRQNAVFSGVALSILLYIIQQSKGVTVRTAVHDDGRLVAEREVEPMLGAEPIVTLKTYGSLFHASAEYFEDQLPHPSAETAPSVVILVLRGHQTLDPTTLNMLTDDATTLNVHHCCLLLAEVELHARQILDHTGTASSLGANSVFEATERVGPSVLDAQAEANDWLSTRR